MDWNKESNRLKRRAHQIVATSKLSTKYPAIKIMIAFIISKKSPKVTIVIGSVKITKIGLTINRNNAITIATITAEP